MSFIIYYRLCGSSLLKLKTRLSNEKKQKERERGQEGTFNHFERRYCASRRDSMLKRWWQEEARKVKKGRKNKNLYLIFISISKNLHENVVIAFLKLVILHNITNLVFSHLNCLPLSLFRRFLLILSAGKSSHLFLV